MKDESVALVVLGETMMFQANTDDVWVAVGLPSAERLLVCARQARKLVMMWQELSLGPTLAEKLWCVHGTRGS